MKVLNLRCALEHSFEGWFGSEADFQDQMARGLLACPMCGDTTVSRLPSAPRLNLSGARAPQSPPAGPATQSPQTVVTPTDSSSGLPGREVQAAWLQAVQRVMRDTEDVGERFPEEARRIHYGECAQRGIRGQASAQECAALADEGIEVMPLPIPAALKGSSH